MNEKMKMAAWIRGLSHNNGKCAIVAFTPEGKGNDQTLKVKAGQNSDDGLAVAFRKYRKERGISPASIEVAGMGLFSLDYPGNHSPSVLNGKVSVVTGGAQGFGEGLVRDLVDQGSIVFIADMNMKGAEALAEELNIKSGRKTAYAVEVNVTEEESVERMMEAIALKTGGVDVFISNAGVLKAGSVKEMTLKDFNFVTSVDYTGYFICTKFAARLMAEQNKMASGYLTDIIQINSKSGLEGSNKNGAYAGAKFGGIGLTQSFALELITDNIKVNSICPGNFLDGPLWSDPDRGLFVQYLNTGKVPGAKTIADVRAFYEAKVPMKRGCTTEDVMKAVRYIVDQKYETGQAVPVTGGQLMLN
ncbi:SDR family NAD(P)-dependent oxidoreductase [Spirochaeta isovalerica]|uniref:Sorbitol-6-phosphate 2-dehydrogenase n=1 Tax=Spirochaeta isovalerica TaxID=150 RepID=A0A841RCF3_9SPIO|nr:SDR family NAD(P)-dependent oxidoreductase [Spirochaeta isovalerica]MBB6480670.1 sorbitol-6-phosphate 2-dehydrogenase [Spirochaeta isovalerica]